MQTASFLKDLFDLSGKTAVVIGGTGELCGTMAVGLARAGAEVVLGGRIPEKAEKRLAEIESFGGKGYFVPVDVTSRESLQHLLDTVIDKSGQVDILINGAGTNSPTPFLDIPEDEYQRIIDTNLSAVFRACQVFGKYFIEEGRAASIINLGSISGLSPLSRVFTYSLSKAAVHNLTATSPASGRTRTSGSTRWSQASSPPSRTARCSMNRACSTSSARRRLPVSEMRTNSSVPPCCSPPPEPARSSPASK